MRAMKAMRLTAMLAISDMDWEAPLEAASMIFLSWLKKNISLAVWHNKSVLFVTNDFIFLKCCLQTDYCLKGRQLTSF